MVERRGRDISGKWIYLCYPCAAMCSGETVLQTHVSGKKHKNKLSMRTIWPIKIFEEHPYIMNEKGTSKSGDAKETENVLQKMAKEVEEFQKPRSELDLKFSKYCGVRCHIQETLDFVKAPLLGIEYLIEHPPEQAHYEPSYICVLCIKQGHPRTIVNHLTCFWHRYNYLLRHFSKACAALTPYRAQNQYREGVAVIMNRLAQRIQDKYGRLTPVNIDKEVYEKEKDQIHQWLFRGYHFSETPDCTFEEVVDPDLITSLDSTKVGVRKKRDPSPPIVAAPTKPIGNNYNTPKKRRPDDPLEALSDVSDEPDFRSVRDDRIHRARPEPKRYEPYPEKRAGSPYRSRYSIRNMPSKPTDDKALPQPRPPNYEYKLKLAAEQRASAEELARKALAYHEKNPEKHPLYPDEWKKFWNRRYKEIQAEGKDPSKHDFKPEWIVFWTARMKELHEDEMRSTVGEIYRRLRVTPPDDKPDGKRKSPDRRRSPERRRSLDRRRSPLGPRRRSPSPGLRRRSPPRRRSPSPRRHPPRRSELEPRRRSPERRDRRSPERRSPPRKAPPPRRGSPLRLLRTRSRSPIPRGLNPSPPPRKQVRSPLSRRESAPRNHSPGRAASGLDTVLVSDEELKPDDGLSPWNSDDSLGSLLEARSPVTHRSRTGSVASRASRRPDMYGKMKQAPMAPQDFGSAENVVATLRILVALEDYLGSLGPKIVDLLAEALKMEKEEANSSEEMLEQEAAVVLIETAKEKLKGAVQAGLVSGSAAAAVRAAVVRAAATLHEADKRIKNKKQQAAASGAARSGVAVPVAGVGEVDREQIAQQMAAALIAQGKTDVSSEELAQLVDAVVGMAEAKKRETESKKKVEARAANNKSTHAPAAASGTASALQMLQSAYDDKKIEKEDAPDAMDGLSDSDLETLLKNFNELSAEEQHSLIAYLKKLEAREPERVERLRQYVSAAANNAPIEEKPDPQPTSLDPVTIESDDDDDYTVEDVFKSATEKVKEDRIRQEMEIVKKSLEETKAPTPPPPDKPPVTTESLNVLKNMSSATDLLALVQAALQSTPASSAQTKTADVVTSATQPRSFGDLPEPQKTEQPKQLLQIPLTFNNQTPNQSVALNSPNQSDFGGSQKTPQAPAWEPRQIPDDYNRGPLNTQGRDTCNSSGSQGPQDNFNQGPRGFQNNYNQSQDSYNQGSLDINNEGSRDNYNQGSQDNYNQGSQGSFNQGPKGNFNQGPQGNFNQGPQGNFNQGPQGNFNPGPQGNFNPGPQGNFNQGPQGKFNQGSQGNFNQGSQGNFNQGFRGQDSYNQGFRGSQDNFNQGSRGQDNSFNQGMHGPQDNYNQNQRGPQNQGQQNNFNRNPPQQSNFNKGPPNNFNQGPKGPQNNFNQPPSLLDNFNQGQSFIPTRGTNDNSYNNQGGRGNFNRNQDRSNTNKQQIGNFRGRGGGRGFGGPRGRGRGHF
ncbi:uncharacterized protein CG7065-like isoform X2 [Maniola jurtina]|nr:uncharacterized protein CG7065-like isoform X2 [Maniola jurtina]